MVKVYGLRLVNQQKKELTEIKFTESGIPKKIARIILKRFKLHFFILG